MIQKFFVHSTFRDRFDQPLRPHGLEWGMPGDSHVTYVPADFPSCIAKEDSVEMRRSILEAHNLWCFAKDLPYKKVEDIESLTFADSQHVLVNWNQDINPTYPHVSKLQDVSELLQSDDLTDTPEIWINGVFAQVLSDKAGLNRVLQLVSGSPTEKLCYKRSPGLVQIDRYFSGYLRNRTQVFDHILDNLIALEDAEAIDGATIIGTATLPDWIMGGELTSRIWVRQEPSNGNILFLRPLRNDDLATSDRRFELEKGRDDDKIAVVMEHMKRLRYVASLEHPFLPGIQTPKKKADAEQDIREKLKKNRKHGGRKVFNL